MKTTIIITRNKTMHSILLEIDYIKNSDCPILIFGETGTGKEIFADYIHSRSSRNAKRFVKVSLSSLPISLFESELFGHEKGAFTGAHSAQQGFFEAAHQATIYLDDIDDFPLPLQSKLLRVIENKELIRIGSNKPRHIDTRIISSSKAELNELVEKRQFRPDLFYRLSVFRIFIPPLRERKEDIPLLLEHFINMNNPSSGSAIDTGKLNLEPLMEYGWRGNVRELKNFAEKLSLHPAEEVYDNFNTIFGNYIFRNNENTNGIEKSKKDSGITEASFSEKVNNFEKNLIEEALKKSFGNINLASKILIIKPTTLRDKITKYKIDTISFKK